MVRALLAGRKTQTRRIVKGVGNDNCLPLKSPTKTKMGISTHVIDAPEHPHLLPVRAAVGDRLWVREAHAMLPRLAYRMSIGTGTIDQREHPTDGYSAAVFREGFDRSGRLQWRPSIHMPRWASRCTLTVTDVRVQQLQDISAGDSIEEGVECATCVVMGKSACNRKGCFASIAAYRELWNAINGESAWDKNPWVAAYSFTVHQGNIDQLVAA
ncbi:hypothetical protein [Cypionkella aquatica]|nr:hypothetical protein [Cypionkella aquatica]